MEKEAQHRSLWNKVRENIDIFQGFNALLSPIYKQHLEELAIIDDIFRQNALNGRLDSARQALHRARMSFKNREYPQAIANSYTVLEVIREIFNPEIIKELKDMQDGAIKDFYAANNNPEDLARVNEEHYHKHHKRNKRNKHNKHHKHNKLHKSHNHNRSQTLQIFQIHKTHKIHKLKLLNQKSQKTTLQQIQKI